MSEFNLIPEGKGVGGSEFVFAGGVVSSFSSGLELLCSSKNFRFASMALQSKTS
jgi:hypothetical protein